MKNKFVDFINDEDGAITVDFVVLTAAICTLGLIVVGVFADDLVDLANEVAVAMVNMNAG